MVNTRKTSRILAVTAAVVAALIVLYLIGFVVAVQVGPALKSPVSTVLEVVYWPLIKCDQNDIEPFNTVIEWLKFR